MTFRGMGLALGGLAMLLVAAPGSAQTIVRPPPPRTPPRPAGGALRTFTYLPATGVVPVPAGPDYRLSAFGANYGPGIPGAAAYAGYAGFPRFGYSSRYGDPAYGYGAFASSYGFPGYNLVGPPYAVRGYQGAYYAPGLTPSLGYGYGDFRRGYGAYVPLSR